jgi:putative NADPH-quinone reductase
MTSCPRMEEDLIALQQLILWADHVVLAYPNWWVYARDDQRFF